MNYVLWEKMDLVSNKIYILFIRNLFGIKGRASRKEYNARFIMMWILGFFSLYMYEIYYLYNKILIGLFAALTGIIFMIYVIQIFFVTHRRLHDLNASGWWQLVTFIPSGQLLMIGFIFFKGTQEANKYGEPPIY
jgi:uncharacterized membrane protein YhaH (DUF805 family)